MSTPSSWRASRSGSLKCSAHEAWQSHGSGTALRGRPMWSAQDGVDPGRDLAEPVVVVPHVQVADREPAPAQLVGDEVDGEELAQVAQVDRPGRGGARRAGDGLALARMPLGVVGGSRDPVGRRAVLSSCHAKVVLLAARGDRAWSRYPSRRKRKAPDSCRARRLARRPLDRIPRGGSRRQPTGRATRACSLALTGPCHKGTPAAGTMMPPCAGSVPLDHGRARLLQASRA